MIDVKKLNTQTKMEIILLWLEILAKKDYLSIHDKAVISAIADLILEEGVLI